MNYLMFLVIYFLIGFVIGSFGRGTDAPANIQKANVATGVLVWPLVLLAVASGAIIFLVGNLCGRIFR